MEKYRQDGAGNYMFLTPSPWSVAGLELRNKLLARSSLPAMIGSFPLSTRLFGIRSAILEKEEGFLRGASTALFNLPRGILYSYPQGHAALDTSYFTARNDKLAACKHVEL